MTIQNLNTEIEKEFAWLTPDEKQKLLSLLKSTWNDAIKSSIENLIEDSGTNSDSLNNLKL